MMKKLVLHLCLCYGLLVNAQETIELGKIMDSIPIPKTDGENFALYLPESFSADKTNSVVFIFDPVGRGAIGIQVFVEAANTHGHILVCSNNIRNGPYQRNFEMAERLVNHVFSKFNINKYQIYLAGFSGGARLAAAIATLTDMAEGVVACGAAFANSPNYIPSNQHFTYVGICGIKDMNFNEMIEAKQYLNKWNFNNTLITFDGNHRWPPPEQILMAFDWLSIEAHKKGYIEKSKETIAQNYTKSLEVANRALSSNNILRAIEEYERILTAYKHRYAVDSIDSKIEILKKSKAYKIAQKSRKVAFEKEGELTDMLIKRFEEDFKNPKEANMAWWEKQLRKLKKEKESTHSELDNMKSRLRYKMYAMAYEKMVLSMPKPDNEQVDFCTKVIKLQNLDFR